MKVITLADLLEDKFDKKEKQLNEELRYIFNAYAKDEAIIFDHLRILKKLFMLVEKKFIDLYKVRKDYEIDWDKIEKVSFKEKLDIIKSFFKSINIDIDIEKLLNDGTFDIAFNDRDKLMENKSLYNKGYSGKSEHPYLIIFDNDVITDSIIWVHELSHHRNLPKGMIESKTRFYLTETMAFTYEFIFIDYLEKIGFREDATTYKYEEIINLFKNAYHSYDILQILILFDSFGCLSRENYEYLFGKEDYEEAINRFIELIKKRSIRQILEYSIASVLSIYLYEEYKKNPLFIKKIEELNSALNNKSFEECLNIVGLTSFIEEGLFNETNYNKINNNLEAFNEQMIEEMKQVELKQKKREMFPVK